MSRPASGRQVPSGLSACPPWGPCWHPLGSPERPLRETASPPWAAKSREQVAAPTACKGVYPASCLHGPGRFHSPRPLAGVVTNVGTGLFRCGAPQKCDRAPIPLPSEPACSCLPPPLLPPRSPACTHWSLSGVLVPG